jgi:hypothetical protein
MAVRESYATQLAALEHQLEEQSRQLAAARAEALSLAAQLEACAPVPLARSSGAGSLQAEVSLDAGTNCACVCVYVIQGLAGGAHEMVLYICTCCSTFRLTIHTSAAVAAAVASAATDYTQHRCSRCEP